jgi:hypothetical protein
MSESEKPAVPDIPWVVSSKGVVEIYTNQVHATWTKDDIRIRLAQIVENPDHPNPGASFRAINEERAAVTFSWRAAKILRNQLTQLVESYEKVNGEININVTLPPAGDQS